MSETSGKTTFVYVTYIRTTPEKLWTALTTPEFHRQYWFGMHCQSGWTAGSPWKMVFEDGRVADSGEILEADPPKKLVIKWRNEWKPELKAEGFSRCTFELEPAEKNPGVMKLAVTHTIDRENSPLITAVSGGWPRILSNLKSLLESGDVVLKAK